MEPYRIFFPMGLVAALVGVGVWIPFAFGWGSFPYPGLVHPDLMIGGFIASFATGFLMTAVPKFTGTPSASAGELAVGAVILGVTLLCGLGEHRLEFHAASCLSFVTLIRYAAVRFRQRQFNPPPFFVFVGLGLGMGAVGSGLLLLSDLEWLGPGGTVAARVTYYQGMVLALILGIGTQLLPAIWGWSALPIGIDRVGQRGPGPLRQLGPAALLAIALTLSIGLEAEGFNRLGALLRAALLTGVALAKWRILRRPKTRGRLAFWLWISAWTLMIGLWAPVLTPTYGVHGLHLSFIGGFGLMTFMIAARVTLAHGGYPAGLEVRLRVFPWVAGFVLLAAVTRAAAFVDSKAYVHHLGYAAIAWVGASLFWLRSFGPRILQLREDR